MDAHIVDFRNFNHEKGSRASDIKIRPVGTSLISEKIGTRRIRQLELLYNNK